MFRGGLQRLEHGLDGGVANGVKANLQIVLAALHGKMCQRILRHVDPPLPVGLIGIVKGKGRCPAAHGAVDIQGAADMLEAVLQGTLILGGLIENLYTQRIAVLIVHQELAGAQRALLCLGAPALHGGHGGKAMGKGYAHSAGGSGIIVIIGIGVQHVALQPVFRLIGKYACGNAAVIHMDARQGKGNLIIQDAHGIEDYGVMVQGEDQNRLIGAVMVQDLAVRRGLFLQAAAVQPAGSDNAAAGRLTPDNLTDLVIIAHMGQIYIPALQAGTHHLKVVVNKPRQYRPAPGINDLHGAGDILRVALSHAQAGNLTALGQKPIGAHIAIHTENLPVFDEQVSLIHGSCSHPTVFFTERV